MEGIVKDVVGYGMGNFGGVMFWELVCVNFCFGGNLLTVCSGSEAMLNVGDGGKDILAYAKEGLGG